MLEFGLTLGASTLDLLVAFSYKTRQFSFLSILPNKIQSSSLLMNKLPVLPTTLLLMITTSSSREKENSTFLVWLSDDSLSWWMIGFGLAVDTSNLELLVAFPCKMRQFFLSTQPSEIQSSSLLMKMIPVPPTMSSLSREERIVPSSFDY